MIKLIVMLTVQYVKEIHITQDKIHQQGIISFLYQHNLIEQIISLYISHSNYQITLPNLYNHTKSICSIILLIVSLIID